MLNVVAFNASKITGFFLRLSILAIKYSDINKADKKS